MKVLDVELPEPLAAFYREVEALFAAEGLSLVCERASGPEFGGFYREEGRALVTVRYDLPPEATCHTLAHELVHGLQRREGWPLASAGPELGADSLAEEVAAVLQALVHCAAAELRIAPLGLDASWEQRERHAGVRYMLRAPTPAPTCPAPQPGPTGACSMPTWSCSTRRRTSRPCCATSGGPSRRREPPGSRRRS